MAELLIPAPSTNTHSRHRPVVPDGPRTDRRNARPYYAHLSGILSAPNSSIEESELAENLPLDVDVLLVSRIDDTVIQVEVLIDQDEHPTLVADEVVDCPHRTEGETLSTLGELGEAYADLEADLMKVAALMGYFPKTEAEFQRYVDRTAFQSLFCDEGLLTFGFRVADAVLRAYREDAFAVGEQVGIPIEPSVEEMVEDE